MHHENITGDGCVPNLEDLNYGWRNLATFLFSLLDRE
jgi:hypothetical protein